MRHQTLAFSSQFLKEGDFGNKIERLKNNVPEFYELFKEIVFLLSYPNRVNLSEPFDFYKFEIILKSEELIKKVEGINL